MAASELKMNAVLTLLENLRKALQLCQQEVSWVMARSAKAAVGHEETIKQQALELAKLKVELVQGSKKVTDERTTQWIHELTGVIIQQREDLVTAQLEREAVAKRSIEANDRILALVEDSFKKLNS